MWHFLYFLPLPHGHGSLRPTRGPLRTAAPAPAPRPRRGRRAEAAAPAVRSGAAADRAAEGLRLRVLRHHLARRARLRLEHLLGGLRLQLDAEEALHEVLAHLAEHRLEQRERFLLVLDQRIALAVGAQPDAALQVVELVQVVAPVLVERVRGRGGAPARA